MNPIFLKVDKGERKISRYIYGHFAEHLGRCIYEGIWVGEDSPIPNTRGIMTALQYAGEFRRYQSYCRHLGGKRLYKIACGQDDEWNEIVMREAAKFMDGLSVHYYTFMRGQPTA
jgi:alpha-L-arabinofuranosidase